MTVQLEELLKAFELNNPYLKFYLNKNDGHMALVTEIPGDDKAENEVTANPDAYIKLPTQADLDLPEMIKGFVPMMKDLERVPSAHHGEAHIRLKRVLNTLTGVDVVMWEVKELAQEVIPKQ